MKNFVSSEIFNFADSWPVGSFRLKPHEGILEAIFHHFDVPCWPELTGLGEVEELIGFWVSLFQAWELAEDPSLIEDRLQARPGIKALAKEMTGKPCHILKGQMIGPATLMWALKQQNALVIDREKILKFVHQAFVSQNFLLRKYAKSVIVSLDEPCAFFDRNAWRVWDELFERFSFEENFGIALHSCGEVSSEIFDLPWNVVHVDFRELLEAMERHPQLVDRMSKFQERGGWLAIGAISSSLLSFVEEQEGLATMCSEFVHRSGIKNILVSTSCGMAETDLSATTEKLKALEQLSKHLVSEGDG